MYQFPPHPSCLCFENSEMLEHTFFKKLFLILLANLELTTTSKQHVELYIAEVFKNELTECRIKTNQRIKGKM